MLDQVTILGVVMAVILLTAMTNVFRFVSRKNDEQDWIAMKSKTEQQKKQNERNTIKHY